MAASQKRSLTSQVSLLARWSWWRHRADSYAKDLKENYDVRMEEGLDTFVVIDGLPKVPQESKQKLVKFLLKKLNSVGRTKEDAIFMPLDDKNMSEGYLLSLMLLICAHAQPDLPSSNMPRPSRPSRLPKSYMAPL